VSTPRGSATSSPGGRWVSEAVGQAGATLPTGPSTLRGIYGRLILLLALLAVVVGGWSVDVWLVIALCLWLAGRLAVGRAFPRIRLRLTLPRTHAFAGERADLVATVSNPSWWPIPWIEVESRQNPDLAGGMRRIEWLPGGAVRTLHVQWHAHTRGVYRVGGFRLRGGDWFGLFRDDREVASSLDLVVYPRVRAVTTPPPVANRLPEGPRRDRGSPFEDDLPAGLRPYRPGDQLRRVAWRASARHDALLVREMPPVREMATCLCLDLCPSSWSDPVEGPERAISLCASLACDRRLAGRPLGLAAWAGTAVKGEALRARDLPGRLLWLSPRAGDAARRRLLRLLAGLDLDRAAAPPFPTLLRVVAPRLPWGAQCLLLLPEDAPDVRRLAAAWQARGHPVSLLCLERRVGPPAEAVGGGTLRTWEVALHADFSLR
jgi:uncharacterized protein (DUF58 family)